MQFIVKPQARIDLPQMPPPNVQATAGTASVSVDTSKKYVLSTSGGTNMVLTGESDYMVTMRPYAGSLGQQWVFEDTANTDSNTPGYYFIRHVTTGKLLEPRGSGSDEYVNGQVIILGDPENIGYWARWTLVSNRDGGYYLQNRNAAVTYETDLVLDGVGNSNGAEVNHWSKGSQDWQNWFLNEVVPVEPVKSLLNPVMMNGGSFPGVDANKRYTLGSMVSAKIIAVEADDRTVTQRKWTASDAQQWRLEPIQDYSSSTPIEDKYFFIVSTSSGKVIGVEGASHDDHAPIVVGPKNASDHNHHWQLLYRGSSQFGLKNRNSGKCIDLPGGTLDEGHGLQQYSDNYDSSSKYNQMWRISEVLDIDAAVATYSNKITIYSGENYTGESQELSVGAHDMDSLTIGNDKAASIKVPDGMVATLFAASHFSGDRARITGDCPSIATSFPELAHQTSSVGVELAVTLYDAANYEGTKQVVSMGSYDIHDLTVGNDKLSSLKVPVGMQVVLYDAGGFTGNTRVITANMPSLNEIGFNDVVSSLHVKMIGNRLPEEPIWFGDKISLKTYHGGQARVYDDATLKGPMESNLTDDHYFEILRVGSTAMGGVLSYGDVVAIKANNGKYWAGWENGYLRADGDLLTSQWAYFAVTRGGETGSRTFVAKGDRISLRCIASGKYVRADNGSGYLLDCSAKSLATYEGFVVNSVQTLSRDTSCAGQACGSNECGAQIINEASCGGNVCGAAFCGAAAVGWNACSTAAAGIVICGMDVAGVTACGVDTTGYGMCGGNLCGANACAAAACGADGCGGAACGAAACGGAACGAAGCGAAACAVDACPVDACGAAGCGADGCAVAANSTACPVEGCGANACVIDVCPADSCAIDACLIDIIPIIPFI